MNDSQRMPAEKAVKLITSLLPVERDDVREAWSVIADRLTDRGQFPPCPTCNINRRDGVFNFDLYKAGVTIDGR